MSKGTDEILKGKPVGQKFKPHSLTGAGGYISGYDASVRSKRPFTNWCDEPIVCEGCGETRHFDQFSGGNELCDYCMGESGFRYMRKVRTPRRDHGDIWKCSCGIENARSRRFCRVCLRPRDWLQGVLGPLTKAEGLSTVKKEGGISMALKMTWEVPQTVPEGKHTGVIEKVEAVERKEGMEYIDITLTCDGEEAKPRAGYPAGLSPTTLLGQLIQRFGAPTDIGTEIDLEEYLVVGTRVQYLTIDKATERGTFSRVVRESLKPLKE